MIRQASLDDIYQIEELEKSVFGSSLGVNFLHFEITQNPFSYYLVYEQNNVIIGYIGLNIVDKYASINNFCVSIKYQRKTIGQQLLDSVFKHLKLINANTLSLEVRVSNQKAISFYEKNLFIKSHIKPLYYDNEDGILYIKEVK